MVLVRIAQPSFLASEAGIGSEKKIQTCPPLPDRDLSRKAEIDNSSHVIRKATVSSCHDFLSKSAARSQQVSSGKRG